MTNKSFDGYTLLTEQFLKVKKITCDDGSSYYEVGASKWKLRMGIECLRKLRDEINKLIGD